MPGATTNHKELWTETCNVVAPDRIRTVAIIARQPTVSVLFQTLNTRCTPELNIEAAEAVALLTERSPSLIIILQQGDDKAALDFVRKQAASTREHFATVPALAFVAALPSPLLSSLIAMGIALVDTTETTPEVAVCAIHLALSGERFASATFISHTCSET